MTEATKDNNNKSGIGFTVVKVTLWYLFILLGTVFYKLYSPQIRGDGLY